MSVASEIYSRSQAVAAITSLVGTRFYPVMAPQGAAQPFIVYRQVTGATENALGGPTTTNESRYEIRGVAATYDAARSLASAIRTAFNGWTAPGGSPEITSCMLEAEGDELVTPADGSDEGTYEVPLDFIIWHLTG